ncbi:unnamed protein product [Lymnaea stagnalis]|uniref:EF-hand domain-containing protein n=1 Tax=Lymnaea stagnalis TaxID=6523 RepID=A0AAV2HWI6_LYMST
MDSDMDGTVDNDLSEVEQTEKLEPHEDQDQDKTYTTNDQQEDELHFPSEEKATYVVTSSRPSSQSSRLVVMTSRPSFTRTPSSMKPNTELESEDDASQEGVLITELQEPDHDEEKVSQDELQDVTTTADQDDLELTSPSPPNDVTEESELRRVEVVISEEKPEEYYDTDLENEEEEEDDFVISYYKTVCDELGIAPIDYFLRRIRNPNIRMRYRGLSLEATRAIALALKDSITLERLDLCGNWIGSEGATYMARMLEENDYVTDVTLSENKFGSIGGDVMANMLIINGGLRRLDLSGNEFDDKCAISFAQAIENNNLRELNLSHNKFSDAGAQLLGPAIGTNENMDVLDLSWNHLRENGGMAIAKGLKENVRLKSCNLSWNGLGVRGGLAVVDALSTNQSLQELDISGNRLNLEVATALAKVLTTNDTIRILKMGNNFITSAGALALASAINNTETCELEELDLTDVPVEYEFLRTIEDVKATRPNFIVRHGPIMRAGNTREDISTPAIDVEKIRKEPVVLLKEHIVINDMRLLDILKRYDESNSLSISAEDFISALEELAVPYDRKRLEDSVRTFAATATGKIYFGSFVSEQKNKLQVNESET